MKIRSKLLLGFSLLLMIILVLGFIHLDRLKYMNSQLDRIYTERYLMIKNSTGMHGDINDLARISTNLVQLQDEAKITAGRKMIESKQESAMQYLSAIQSMVDTAEER
ncbi:MCP four helix bundle domain-containing protein, partial [Achromobacter sp. Marseille-Q0513]|uniref:MCP four helix bundle domain-containing protein n=2 Tax=Bacteria TaxID=2 RepID=UPI002010D185